MADDNLLSTYLTPPPDALWKWTDGGEVLAWPDGSTIAFRGELEQILARLAPRGLPALGAVALLLAATRDNWPGKLDAAGAVTSHPEMLAEVVRGLDRVHALDADLRSTLAARTELADLVFESCTERTPTATTAAVLQALKDGLSENVTDPPFRLMNRVLHAEVVGEHPWVPLSILRCLLTGLGRIDADTVALRLKTGLDDVVQPTEVDLPPVEGTRTLIARLLADEELSGLGRLAHDLMAAVSLPRPVSEQEDLPLGGLSDISNRGPLDRLLLSELAHDDLTLAVRVANGEALYLRREQPPRQPPRQRVVLLETGLRSWGVPRVFATAVALALAATTDSHTRVVFYRARGKAWVPVDLGTRQGLVEHLAALEPEAHPGAAVGQAAGLPGEGQASGLPHDLILVTSGDVLADRDFQKALAAVNVFPLHVASVWRDGRFQLFLMGPRGSKVLRTALLSLDDLFAEKKVKPKLLDPSKPRGLPAILSVRPFPLLLPPEINPRASWHVPGLGVLSLSKDHRLTLWTEVNRGPVQLADNVPPGSLLWASAEAHDGAVRAVVGQVHSGGALHLLTIHTEDQRIEVQPLERDGSHCWAVCAHNGVLFLILSPHVAVVDQATGRRLHTMRLPSGVNWKNGRFFTDTTQHCWLALSCDGLATRLEKVLDASDPHGRAVCALFECVGIDGAIGVTSSGALYFTAKKRLADFGLRLDSPVLVLGVSRRGDRLVLADRNRRSCLVEVQTGKVTEVSGNALTWVERLDNCVRPQSLRTHFTHVTITRRRVLALRSRKNTVHGIVRDGAGLIRLEPGSLELTDVAKPLTFQPTNAPSGVGYRLKVATWPDGSRIFLDSRGLLHLQSADRAVPEATLVLTDGPLSGWCSNGLAWGAPYFLGDVTQADQAHVYNSAIRAFIERLP